MYKNGLGVEVDYKKAIRLYTLSTIQGNKSAQNNLANIYQYSFSVQEMLQIKIKSFTGFVAFLVGLLLVCITGLAWFFHGTAVSPKEIHNIILISIDTCRADHLSCYGYSLNTTRISTLLSAKAYSLKM